MSTGQPRPTEGTSENSHSFTATEAAEDTIKENEKYITGAKLIAVVGSVTLIAFLLLLDQSILGTVSRVDTNCTVFSLDNICRQFLVSRLNFTRFPMLDGIRASTHLQSTTPPFQHPMTLGLYISTQRCSSTT
jgi:hypothetical protein